MKEIDAVIDCYYQADLEVLESLFQPSDYQSKEVEETKRKHMDVMIKKFFHDVNGDFNNSTKESLVKVIDKCREFAKCFRDQSVIQEHYNKILMLINRIE